MTILFLLDVYLILCTVMQKYNDTLFISIYGSNCFILI